MRRVFFKYSAFVVLAMTFSIHADKITINNKTNEPFFVAIYYQRTDQEATLASNVMAVAPKSKITMNRPERKAYRIVPPAYYDRNLVVAHNAALLKKTIDPYTLRTLPSLNIGSAKGSTFYFASQNGVIKGYNKAEWLVVKPVMDVTKQVTKGIERYTTDQIKEYIRSHYTAAKKNPYKKSIATVQRGNQLSAQEKEYLNRRAPVVQASLEKILSRSLTGKYIPKIACVFSGGGYRAMASTIGSLMGAQETGLLGATTWTVGLSGSTWALGTWLVSQDPIMQFSDKLFSLIGKHITKVNSHNTELIAHALMVKWAYNQPITLVDLYGAFLANTFFSYKGNARQRVYLSNQASTINTHDWPLPIFTAIQTGRNDPSPRWYEFSPYEIGSSELGMYVEPWAFGRKFFDGVSKDEAPEQTFGFLMGIFGAAFAAPLEKIHAEMMAGITDKTTKKLMEIIFQGIEKVIGEKRSESIGKKRVVNSWAEIPNFSLGLRESPINNQEIIRFSDAGIAFNLPYPPISGERPERKADLIILFDYSSGINDPTSLRGIEEYARRKNLPFPPIDYAQVSKRAISVFKDEKNKQVPAVVYIPLIRDESLWNSAKVKPEFKMYLEQLDRFDPVKCSESGFCTTTNFEYNKKQAQQLAAHNAFVVKACKDEIANTIAWVIDRKS